VQRTYTLVKGMANFKLQYTVKDADGVVEDITSATVVLKVRQFNFDTNQFEDGALALEITGDVTDGANGKCEFTMPEITLDPDEDWLGEIEITLIDKVLIVPGLRFEILSSVEPD